MTAAQHARAVAEAADEGLAAARTHHDTATLALVLLAPGDPARAEARARLYHAAAALTLAHDFAIAAWKLVEQALHLEDAA